MNLGLRRAILLPLTVIGLLVGSATASAAPANDDFASAQVIGATLPTTVPGNNIGATAEAGEPLIEGITTQKSVWYKFTAPVSTTYVLDTCNDGFTGAPAYEEPLMAVHSGATLATLVNVAEVNGRCSLRFPGTAGTTYSLQVDYYEFEGNFNLSLRRLTPAPNDNFATPTTLGPALPVLANGTTVDATWEAGEPATFGGVNNSRSVWFRYTPTSTQRVRLSLCEKTQVDGPLNDRVVVYTGNTLATLVLVTELSANDCNVDLPVTAGTPYRIGISGPHPGEFTFQLELKAAPPPPNDNFANALTVGPSLPVNATGNNDFATEEAGEPNDHGDYPSGTSRSVWFSWTAGVSGRVRVKACNPEINFFTSVYTGATLATLTEVSESFDYASCSRFFDAVAGTKYRIAVAGGPFDGSYGPFSFNIHQVQFPANDAFDAAINLGSRLSVSRQGTTVDATREENEPDHGAYGSSGGSVWYRWTAPSDDPVVLSACSSGEPNQITVYDDIPDPLPEQTGMYALRKIDFDSDSCRGDLNGGRLAIAPVRGLEYKIVISPAEEDYESPFTLTIGNPAKPKPAFNLKRAIAKCKKKFRGTKGKTKRKRSRCIKSARKKAALIKCGKLKNQKKRAACIRKTRRKFK